MLPLLPVLAIIASTLAIAAVVVLLRRTSRSNEVAGILQQAAGALSQHQAEMALLADRAARIEPLLQTVTDLQQQVVRLAERASQVEQNQGRVSDGVALLGAGLAETNTLARTLAGVTDTIRDEVTRAGIGLARLQEQSISRHGMEQSALESIKRIELVLAGTQSRGAAGENIVEQVLASLPPEWQVRNFRVGDRVVEFGLRLPNSLVLPIDSKWSGAGLLEELAATEDPAERRRLKSQIREALLARAREIRKYIDPTMTPGFAVAAVPDAVYQLSAGIQGELFKLNVVMISYGLIGPYLLLVFQTMLKSHQSFDLRHAACSLQSIKRNVAAIQDEIEGRFSRALTLLGNSREEMRAQAGRMAATLAGLELEAPSANDEDVFENLLEISGD